MSKKQKQRERRQGRKGRNHNRRGRGRRFQDSNLPVKEEIEPGYEPSDPEKFVGQAVHPVLQMLPILGIIDGGAEFLCEEKKVDREFIVTKKQRDSDGNVLLDDDGKPVLQRDANGKPIRFKVQKIRYNQVTRMASAGWARAH